MTKLAIKLASCRQKIPEAEFVDIILDDNNPIREANCVFIDSFNLQCSQRVQTMILTVRSTVFVSKSRPLKRRSL